jgi:hypothetical protein
LSVYPLYRFDEPPPRQHAIFFDGSKLFQMAMYGGCACPYTPPQWTIFPSDGQVGRWTLHFDVVDPLTDDSPWKFTVEDMLPGMRMRYEDFDTGRRWIWVLTDKTITGDVEYRLGVWPD